MNSDPFQNPYQQNFSPANHESPLLKSSTKVDFLNQNIDCEDYEFNLNYNRYMLYFQPNSINILAFDFLSQQWAKCPNLTNFLISSEFRSVQLPNYSFILTGGRDAHLQTLRSVNLYMDGYFSRKPDMMDCRSEHCSIYNDGYVYVFGGINEKGILNSAEKMNVKTLIWEPIASLKIGRYGASCCMFSRNRIIIAGGYHDLGVEEFFENYDINNNIFENLQLKMPDNLNLLLPSMVQINEEEIIIFGGFIINKNLYNYDNLCVNIRNGKNIKRGKNDIPGYGVYPPYLVDEDSFFIFFGGGDFPPNFAKICLNN